MFKSRTVSVLKALVEEYIGTATPVASEEITRRLSTKVSPATVRHEMAELEEEGYITRPHISAGGVPSDKGYRFYVESLEEGLEPPVGLQCHIKNQFGHVERDQEGLTRVAATLLSRITDNMAVVTFPGAESSKLKYIQLVLLQRFLALLIVVLQGARLKQHLVPLTEPSTQSELTEVANKLNHLIAGLTYSEIEATQMGLSPLEELVRQDTMSILEDVENQASLEHYVDGLSLLLGQPEFAETRRAKEVVEVLEEKQLLKGVLSAAADKESTVIFIGEENREEALKPFAVILSRYGIPYEASGIMCVIGPTRMEYANVIGGVSFLSSYMSDLMMGLYGKS